MDDSAYDPGRILGVLVADGVEFVVIGGIARVFHGSERPTGDVDVLIGTDVQNLERLAKALNTLRSRLRAGRDTLPVTIDVDRLRAGANFSWATEAGDLDTFTEVEGGHRYASVVDRAWRASTDRGDTVLVIGLTDLIKMKQAAKRPRDQLDLLELREIERLKAETDEGSGPS